MLLCYEIFIFEIKNDFLEICVGDMFEYFELDWCLCNDFVFVCIDLCNVV